MFCAAMQWLTAAARTSYDDDDDDRRPTSPHSRNWVAEPAGMHVYEEGRQTRLCSLLVTNGGWVELAVMHYETLNTSTITINRHLSSDPLQN